MKGICIRFLAVLLLPCLAFAKDLEELLAEKGVITKCGASCESAQASTSKVYWKNGTQFEFPDTGFTSAFATYLQERYIFTDADEDTAGRNTSSFETRNARLVISGTALHNEFAYRMEPDFVAGRNGTERTPFLRDAWITWNALDSASVQMGQFKTFVSRQFVTSSHTLQLPEEALVSRAFNLGYQQGLSGKLTSEDKTLMLRAGVFNGQSTGEGQNKPGLDTKQTGIVTARWNMGKIDPYEETDVNYTQDPAASVGVTYAVSDANVVRSEETGLEELNKQIVNVDAIMKYRGLSLAGEFYWGDTDPEWTDENINPLGFYVQAGYFFVPGKWELAGRYSYLDCDAGACPGSVIPPGVDKSQEVSAALNYYFWKHSLKAALGWSWEDDDYQEGEVDSAKINKWIMQVTTYF